jgi:hypothetical protein
MKKAVHLIATLAIVGSFGLGVAALLSTPARAVDNPCDPVFRMLQQCKAQHGHWSSACCCCQLH